MAASRSSRSAATKLDRVNRIARKLGIKETIHKSSRRSKKFMVRFRGNLIHFGAAGFQDFLDHGDARRRESYLRRARGIRDGHGRLTHRDRNRANFWAINLLW